MASISEIWWSEFSEPAGQTLSAHEVEVDGGITTNGAGIAPVEMHGTIGTLRVGGGLKAAGGGFDTT